MKKLPRLIEKSSDVDKTCTDLMNSDNRRRASEDHKHSRCREPRLQIKIRATGLNEEAARKERASAPHTGRENSKTSFFNKITHGPCSMMNLLDQDCYQPKPAIRFPSWEAQRLMKTILDSRLRNAVYNGACSVLVKELADNVKVAVKKILCERYKVICFVAMGQVKDCDVACFSRSVWCPASDTFAEYCFKNGSLYALCVLYAIYKE